MALGSIKTVGCAPSIMEKDTALYIPLFVISIAVAPAEHPKSLS